MTTAAQEEVLGKAYDARLMRRLLVYLRPHRVAVAVAFVTILIASTIELAQPWLTERAIDRYIPARDSAGLGWLAAIYFALLVIQFLVEYTQTYLLQTIGQRIMHAMRMQVYEHLQRLDLKFYDRHPVGRLMTRVTTDVDALNDLFTSGVITVFGDLLVLVGIMVAMLVMNWRLALVAYTVLPFIAWAAHWFRTHVRDSYRRVRGLIARVNAFLQEHVTGIATVQLFNQQDRTATRFDAINREHRDANIASIFYYAVFYPLIELVAAASSALIVWVGGGWTMRGLVSVGVLVAFLQYSRRFFQPISDLSEKFNILQAAMAASERIFGVLDTPIEIDRSGALESVTPIGAAEALRPAIRPADTSPAPAPGRRPAATSLSIEFEHVWFAYDGEHFVLRDVSFTIAPGERIGIVGATGSGKTTIISLLLRFYDVSRGRILVGGVDVREWPVGDLRRLFGLVLQDVHLFSGTIAENIRLGDASIAEDDVVRAARTVHANRFIEARPGGYAGVVTERGATLSVGQKQLLSFARAVAFDPSVLLLDEATSSIDTATEALIEDALRVIMTGRTVIAIAHRLSTIQDVDRILVLHKGELREYGTHQELLARRGLYFRLYQLQYR